MKLPDWLLATLACPRCKGPLTLIPATTPPATTHPATTPPATTPPATTPLPPGEGRGEGIRPPGSHPGSTTAAELCCHTCARAYPIRDGIPVLLPEESRPYANSGN
ncbi:Trm112 family protein [Archangium gephyra]|uniref:Trm112 family protein n=1 Tax=Archangium gephyra TaxID=48 RepID=UPI000E278059